MTLEELGSLFWLCWIGVCVIVMWVVELKRKGVRNNDRRRENVYHKRE